MAAQQAIIIRPLGGRRYKYLSLDKGTRIAWMNDPEEAQKFDSAQIAEEVKNTNKSHFGPDDEIVESREFDGEHCRYCYAPGKTLRRDAVESSANIVKIELRCTHCNLVEVVSYTFAKVGRKSI